MSKMQLNATFEKIDPRTRMVWGYASTEAKDSQGEIVKREALAAALPDFMRFGNIREMHRPSAVGKAKQAEIDPRGLYLGVKVVDDAAWEKVREGVYSGFSIAGRVTERDPAEPHIITGCTLDEISLVDRPANPEAVFTMFKRDRIAKEGRRHSAADLAELQAIHDRTVALGACCPGAGVSDNADAEDTDDMGGGAEPAELDDDDGAVAKGAVRSPVLDRLERAIAALAAECRSIGRRVATIEAQPAPPRGALRSLGKHEDRGRPDEVGGDRSVHQMIKDALGRPHRL